MRSKVKTILLKKVNITDMSVKILLLVDNIGLLTMVRFVLSILFINEIRDTIYRLKLRLHSYTMVYKPQLLWSV